MSNPIPAPLRAHVVNLETAVATAIVREAQHTARLACEDGADTARGQGRLFKTLRRATTPAEQLALTRCVYAILDAHEPS